MTKILHTGLTEAEVIESRRQHGDNVLRPRSRESLWKRFLAKFADPLILILLVAGALSVGIALYEHFALARGWDAFFEPVGIFVAILLATGLAFLFELKADREFSLLNLVNDDEPVKVIRQHNARQVPRRDVVTGDLVLLNTGEEVPADGRLLEAVSLTVDESTLTGEPLCHKTVDEADFDADATFPSDCVLRGTKVMEGHGLMQVTAVGMATEYGKVYEAVQIDDSVKTPLNEQLDGLGALITRVSYAFAALVIVGRLWMYFSSPHTAELADFLSYLFQTVMIAVTLIVVAVPEGLPMAVTLSLAYSMRRMLHTHNLVRRMHACETMGATTVICTDKTGTLTQNRMQVADARFTSSVPEAQIQEGIAVNTTAQLDFSPSDGPAVLGNPTEGALLLWLHRRGTDYRTLKEAVVEEAEIPFTTERKYMATVVRKADGQRMLYVKGAPEIVASLCAEYPTDLTAGQMEETCRTYQQQAMRTLGFACQRLDAGEPGIADGTLRNSHLIYIGIVGITDPVREEVPAAVATCQRAGIDIKIVTGDTPATACEIARRIGLWTDGDGARNLITGPELAALSDEELQERVLDLKIIARARPLDKRRLVEALQARGQVVAVTGDGTNDAPALKAAHVGLSMGDGTIVAKEASDITILDNSFSSIGRSVMWGRSLYLNIQRFILFQMTVNVAACFIVLAGAFMGTESPLTVTQMLWVNLIMDTFAAMALASLPPSEAVMNEPPRRRSAFIINGAMRRGIIGVGGVFFLLLWGLLGVMERDGLTPYELSQFFTLFVFLQFWNLFNARAFLTGRSAFHFRHCSEFLTIVALIFVGQILIVTFGGELFGVVPLAFTDWVKIISGSSVVLWIGEFIRFFHRKIGGSGN
jgi:Ca2+-transporting ATPase